MPASHSSRRSTDRASDAALLHARRCARVVYYPYGFLADNAESELEGRMALDGHPFQSRYVPCLNGSPYLMEALVGQILAQARVGRQAEARPAAASGISVPA